MPLFPVIIRARALRSTRRAPPMGSACEVRSYALHRPGLSVRGGPMQVNDATNRGLIPLIAQGQTFAPMLSPPSRRGCITKPDERRNAEADGSLFHF